MSSTIDKGVEIAGDQAKAAGEGLKSAGEEVVEKLNGS